MNNPKKSMGGEPGDHRKKEHGGHGSRGGYNGGSSRGGGPNGGSRGGSNGSSRGGYRPHGDYGARDGHNSSRTGHISFHVCLLTIFCCISLLCVFKCFSPVETSFAEESDDESGDYLCAIAVSEKGDELMEDFQGFLNDYLAQNVPVSEQVENAASYFRYVESSLRKTYEEETDFSGIKSFQSASSEISLCNKRLNQYISEAELRLETSLRYATSSKRSYKFVDGLKAMNEDMKDFSMNFHQAFPGRFNEMNSSLTCFAKGCLTK